MFVEFNAVGGWYTLRDQPAGEVLVPRFWKENAERILDAQPNVVTGILAAAKRSASRRIPGQQ